MKHLFFPILHFNYTDVLSAGGLELILDPYDSPEINNYSYMWALKIETETVDN